MKFARATVVLAVWLMTATAGAWLLYRYENTPGERKPTLEEWLAATHLTRATNRPTLVMFAHPQCPCTRASIEELNRLLARCSGQLACKVFIFQPSTQSPEWSRGSLWKSAQAIPGVEVQGDPDGVEAHRFGAETSGFVLLFNTQGRLLFHGGITSGRGHSGDNPGADAIVSLASGRPSSMCQTPVFGCGLLDNCRASTN